MKDVTINLDHIPFSRYGAYVSVNRDRKNGLFVIHNVERRFGEDEAFTLQFTRGGNSVDYTYEMRPDRITVTADRGSATIFVRGDHTLAFEAHGLDLEFRAITGHGYGTEYGPDDFCVISVNQRTTSRFHVFRGAGELRGPIGRFQSNENLDWKRDLTVRADGGAAAVTLTIMNVEHKLRREPFDVERETAAVRAEWERFLARMPPAPAGRHDFAVATWYTLWSCFVRARDHYRYDAMLMSKKFMSSVWTWDHCFNALAMMKVSRQTALEQFLLPFELQAESGTLFDMTNPNQEVIWAVTKPPIHGWCFGRMMDAFDFEPAVLEKVLGHLAAWTNWWMEYRDSDGDGIPEYPQGCDSGWDNSTLFDGGFFLESPDLSAFLVLQMHTCARIAKLLGKAEEAGRWRRSAHELRERLYDHSWVGGRFVARRSGSHTYDPEPTSLLALMPIALGEHLDRDKMAVLAGLLEERFLTEHGPATEAPDSPRYESDGYWRGPIWAPSTYLIVDGLRRGGHDALARRIAASFCRMAEHKAMGQYENFDALTGAGLRAPGYTWTASVFMLLTWEYLQDG